MPLSTALLVVRNPVVRNLVQQGVTIRRTLLLILTSLTIISTTTNRTQPFHLFLPYSLQQLYNSYTSRSRYTFSSDFNCALLRDTPITPSAIFTISVISATISATSTISVIFAIPKYPRLLPQAPIDLHTSPLYFLTFPFLFINVASVCISRGYKLQYAQSVCGRGCIA